MKGDVNVFPIKFFNERMATLPTKKKSKNSVSVKDVVNLYQNMLFLSSDLR